MENLGKMGGRYFPFVFGLFVYILILNVAELFSYIFTPASLIVLTLRLSNSIVLGATILGIGVFFEFFNAGWGTTYTWLV